MSPASKSIGRNGNTPVDPHVWVQRLGIKSTAQVALPKLLMDEVIGQEEAVDVARKAAKQRRHLLLLGDPGTGKSMIAKAMSEILPKVTLDEVLVVPNPKDDNAPHIKVVAGGNAQREVRRARTRARRRGILYRIIEWTIVALFLLAALVVFSVFDANPSSIIAAVLLVICAILFLMLTRQFVRRPDAAVPNPIITRPTGPAQVPYVEATGSHSGALLGDVRHDPYQSGGLQTPTHLRVEPGAIHRAHKGVLYIDEINLLRYDSQQALLTAMQEKAFPITGQSEGSSGATARTEPVPCDFILVAAGNLDVINPSRDGATGLHPALRSRIRGYGYEVYVKSFMDDTEENRNRLVRFVAQEVRRDGRIPHFTAAAVAEIIREAQRRSGKIGKLTLRLRELGGLVRSAGDLARDANLKEVSLENVLAARRISQSLEQQVMRRSLELRTAQEAFETNVGPRVGVVAGCSFVGTGETGEPAGLVVPLEAGAGPSSDRQRGHVNLSGGLERDPALYDQVAAILQRVKGGTMSSLDIHCQAFLSDDNAALAPLGLAAAMACLSALQKKPMRSDTVAVGALSVSGRLRRVEAITQMIEGAADLGYARAIVPYGNRDDILLEHSYRGRIQIVTAKTLDEALTLFNAASAQGRSDGSTNPVVLAQR